MDSSASAIGYRKATLANVPDMVRCRVAVGYHLSPRGRAFVDYKACVDEQLDVEVTWPMIFRTAVISVLSMALAAWVLAKWSRDEHDRRKYQ